MASLKQSTAYTRTFLMVLSSDHITGATGKTVTVNLSKAGAAFGAAGGAVSEIANGWYKVSLNTTDTGTLGDLAFHCTASACDDTDFCDQVTALVLGDMATPTNITAGTITTATNVTTVNGLASGVITATSIASNAITAAKIATDAIGAAQLAADAVTEIQSGLATSSALTTVSNKLGSITGSGSNTVLGYFQSIARSDVTASTDLAGTFSSATDSLQALKDDQMTAAELEDTVWDAAIASHLDSGSTGSALNSASSAGDPWNTALPGAYGSGTAGNIIGNRIDAAITSRLAPTTSGRTLDVTATGEAGIDWANIGSPTTSVNLSGTSTKALEPTTAGRTLDVSTTGEAGIDWANVGSPTTSLNLSGTTISTSQAIASVSGAVGSVTGAVGSVTARVTANADQLAGQTVTAAAGVTFPASVASPTNITAGTITTVTNLTNAPTSGDLTATMKASVTTAATAATPTAAAVTGAVGSVTGNVGGSVASLGATAQASVKTQCDNSLLGFGAIP